MKWVAPLYDRQIVNEAARAILVEPTFPHSPEDYDEVELQYGIIGNWRSSHSFPLNTFKIGLLHKARQVDDASLVAQRLKRLSSIAAKLQRYRTMKLSQMQDIAGCRAIVSSVSAVYELVALYKRSDIKHKLVHEDDYIARPKESGYRSYHLIYGYYSDKKATYNGLKVELQLRSALQHAWATAVETVGTFIQQALKSSQGEKDWLRFFALMGTAIAIRERSALVPDTPTERRLLKKELTDYVERLDVENHLSVYAAALNTPEEAGAKDAHYFLLELDVSTKRVKITGYKADELEKASKDYLSAERGTISGQSGRDAVLVSVDSLEALKKAYPNYFLDTHRFIQAVKQAISP
jgi:Region found in RelA / SpoT proteins